jgi:hypothetical protein
LRSRCGDRFSCFPQGLFAPEFSKHSAFSCLADLLRAAGLGVGRCLAQADSGKLKLREKSKKMLTRFLLV